MHVGDLCSFTVLMGVQDSRPEFRETLPCPEAGDRQVKPEPKHQVYPQYVPARSQICSQGSCCKKERLMVEKRILDSFEITVYSATLHFLLRVRVDLIYPPDL